MHRRIDMPTTEKTRLTEIEAAEFLGVRRQTLAAWRCLGRHDLPFEKIGRLVRYRMADLEAFCAARRGTSCAEIEANLTA
jgi:excisionase family DNA binding protein